MIQKNRIAFIFKSAPHGNSRGREGLDAILALSSLTEDIGVFFISDGVFQIVDKQKPNKIFARDYISTFKVLPLYGIKTIRICDSSLSERGLKRKSLFIINNALVITTSELCEELTQYDIILSF